MVSPSDTSNKKPSEDGPPPQLQDPHGDAAEEPTQRRNPFIVPLFSLKKEAARGSGATVPEEKASTRNDAPEPKEPASPDVAVLGREEQKREPASEKQETDGKNNQACPTGTALPQQNSVTDETASLSTPASIEEETPIYALSSRSYNVIDDKVAGKVPQRDYGVPPTSGKTTSTLRSGYRDERQPLPVDSPREPEGAAKKDKSTNAAFPSPPQRAATSQKNPEHSKSAISDIKIGTDDNYSQDSLEAAQRLLVAAQHRFSFKKLFSRKHRKKRKYLPPAQKKSTPAKPSTAPVEAQARTFTPLIKPKTSPHKKGDNAVPGISHETPKVTQPHKNAKLKSQTGKNPMAPSTEKNAKEPKTNKPKTPPERKKFSPPKTASAPVTPGRFSKFIQLFRPYKNPFRKKDVQKVLRPITKPKTGEKATQRPEPTGKKPGGAIRDMLAPSETAPETPTSPATETTTLEEPSVRRSRRDARQKASPPTPKKESAPLPTPPALPEIVLPREIEKPQPEPKRTKKVRKKQLRLAKAQLPPPVRRHLPQLLVRAVNITLKSLTIITVATLLAATVLIVFYFNAVSTANTPGEKNRVDLYNANTALIEAVDTLKPGIKTRYHPLLDSIRADLEEHNKLLEKTNTTTQAKPLTLNDVSDFAAELNAGAHKAYTSALGASTDLSGLFASISVAQYFKAQALVDAGIADPTRLSWKFSEENAALTSHPDSCTSITDVEGAPRKDSILYNTSLSEQYTVYMLEVEAARQGTVTPETKETILFHRKQQQSLNYYLHDDCVEIPLQEAAFSLPEDFGTDPQPAILEQNNNLLGSYAHLIAATAEKKASSAPQDPQVRAFAVNSMFSVIQHTVNLGAALGPTPGLEL